MTAKTLLAGALTLAVLCGSAVWLFASREHDITVTASFRQTVGLYPGNDVRVLGVPMGTITSITPTGDRVRVTMRLDADTPVAADTRAVIVPPGILASRYVQLTRPWLHGRRLSDGAHLGLARTTAPLELDDVTRQLDRFLSALGPHGANSKGALSGLVATSARALAGNGRAIRTSLHDVAEALDTLARSRGDIVATISQLQRFVATLDRSTAAIRVLERSLAQVSTQLADQRRDLQRMIGQLATATSAVGRFVRHNRGSIHANVQTLARLTTTLADRQRELTEIADLTPVGTEGIFGAANLSTEVLDARTDLSPLLQHPDTLTCQIYQGLVLPRLCPSSVPHPRNGGRR